MGVRVRVRIKYGDAALDLVALVNTGYETDVPEILVPVSVAEKLEYIQGCWTAPWSRRIRPRQG